jgi:hypothetical protein
MNLCSVAIPMNDLIATAFLGVGLIASIFSGSTAIPSSEMMCPR